MPGGSDLRIGVDVGGTHTDAVLLDTAHHVVAKLKVPTTPDVTSGVRAALDGVLAGEDARPAGRITHVMVGTTHAMNAILERRRLRRVAVVRLAAPSGLAIRPLLAWPAELRDAVLAGAAIVGGGHELDGREIAPRACAGVIRKPASMAEPPIATAVARSSRSPHAASSGRKVATLPWQSAITSNPGGTPATFIETIGTSGKARPMASASSSGTPSSAAKATGSTPLEPPISIDMSALTGCPVRVSISSRTSRASVPDGSFSSPTVGAPIVPIGTISPSPRSSRPTSGTGPCSSSAWMTMSVPGYVCPPPPVPRMPQPAARSSTSSRVISFM
jgi:hypothetical protein